MRQPTADEGIGQLILDRYEALGMTQADTARAANISDTTLREIERGDIRRRRAKTLHDLSAALRWPPNALARLLAGELPEDIGLQLGADTASANGHVPPWEQLLAGQREIRDAIADLAHRFDRRPDDDLTPGERAEVLATIEQLKARRH